MTQTYDAVIIGAGIMGMSTAFHLTRRGIRKVAVLERGSQVAAGSTGHSSAIVRQFYANRELVQLANSSIKMFENWCDLLELKENRSGFNQVGVLWIAEDAERFEGSLQHFESVGVAGGLCTAAEAAAEYPALNLCPARMDLEGAEHECRPAERVLWERDGGYADSQGTTEDLAAAAAAGGAVIKLRHQVTALAAQPGGGFRVSCSNGELFSCGLLLNAAGPWCGRINALADVTLPLPLRPTRVQIALRDRPETVRGKLPVFTSIADGLYGRPDGAGRILTGSTAPEDECEYIDDPDDYDERCSAEFRDKLMHKLHHRLDMKTRGTVSGYAALYTINTADWHPIVDRIGPDGYFVANGFSGHGFKLGPSLGALIAHKMTGLALKDDAPVDLCCFAADRRPISSSGGVLA